MRRILLFTPEPRPDQGVVRFRWEVSPASELYRTTAFSVRFPPEIDLAIVPESIWWVVMILCLHGHWNLLRPCRVELPVTLGDGEAEFWRRLLEVEQWTLSAYRGANTVADAKRTAGDLPPPGDLELVESGTRLKPAERRVVGERCATAFSGGKDSLLQAALLAELTEDPLLVATTSPMPPLNDHATARRRQVLDAIGRRRNLELIEVESNLRSIWQNDFPPSIGYPVAVNEVTDTNLYAANTLVAGWVRGAGQLFLASETELQESVPCGASAIAQHPHCMYSLANLRALSSLLAPWGLTLGSLLGALHSEQVQQLLWRRYSDLRDLQYSCWRVGPGEATCSRCSQCLRLAMTALALGDQPQEMGIHLGRLLRSQAGWTPRFPSPDALPAARVSFDLHAQVIRAAVETPVSRVVASLVRGEPSSFLKPTGWQAVRDYRRLRQRLVGVAPSPRPGYRPRFAQWIEGPLGRRIEAVFAEHFRPAPLASYADLQARSAALTEYIVQPLAVARARSFPRSVPA